MDLETQEIDGKSNQKGHARGSPKPEAPRAQIMRSTLERIQGQMALRWVRLLKGLNGYPKKGLERILYC